MPLHKEDGSLQNLTPETPFRKWKRFLSPFQKVGSCFLGAY